MPGITSSNNNNNNSSPEKIKLITIEKVETIEKEGILDRSLKITISWRFLVELDQAFKAFPSVGISAWGVRRTPCLRNVELKSGVAE